MKKTLIGIAAALAGTMVFAGQENVPITISTMAPAVYADGTTVKQGEFFALVWVKDAETEVSFAADGSLAAPEGAAEILIAGPWANEVGWLWSPRSYTIPAAVAAKGGELRLLVLDTRKADGTLFGGYELDKSGCVVLADDGKALPVAVNAGDPIANLVLGSNISTISGVGEIKVASVSALPPNAPQSEIVATRFEGRGKDRKMVLTVKNTAWYAKYNAAKSASPDAIGNEKAADKPVDGKASPDETIDVSVPAPEDENAAFIKIIRN